MDYPIYIDTKSMDSSIWYFKGCQSQFLKNDTFCQRIMFFIIENSADPAKMPPYVAIYLTKVPA